MEKDKKYNIVLGLMIFFFILVVGISLAWGLSSIGKKSSESETNAQNSEIVNVNESDNKENVKDTSSNKNNDEIKEQITAIEKNAIKEYVAKIYKYGTIGTIPNFSDINEADEEWLWYVAFRECGAEQIYKPEIILVAKELFGKQFGKEPGNNILGAYWDEEGQYYTSKAHGLMVEEEPHYIIYNVVKNDNKYNVEIVEYLLDMSEVIKGEKENITIGIKNKDKELKRVLASNDDDYIEIEKYVKENASKFSSRILEIEEVNGKLHIVSCSNK